MIRRTRRAPAPPRRMAAIFTTAVLGLGAISTAGCSNTDDGADSATTVAPTSSGNTPSGAETTTPPMLVPELFDATDTSFYATPEPVPAGNHGDLVRYQLTGNQPNGMTRYRVMYLSETRRGDRAGGGAIRRWTLGGMAGAHLQPRLERNRRQLRHINGCRRDPGV